MALDTLTKAKIALKAAAFGAGAAVVLGLVALHGLLAGLFVIVLALGVLYWRR